MKRENRVGDEFGCDIKCPKCDDIISVANRGCNVITCTNHNPFIHFCVHCKAICKDNYSTCGCESRNTVETRSRALERHNLESRRNPIEIDMTDEEDSNNSGD